MFIHKMVEKAETQVMIKEKMKIKRKMLKIKEMEESKKNDAKVQDAIEDQSEDEELKYPDECKVLDIMN